MRKEISELEEFNSPSDILEEKKSELELIRMEKINGNLIRSRAKWAEEGEKPTKYFCSLESRNYVSKLIPKIEKEDGTTITKQTEILKEVGNYYKSLYEQKHEPEINLKEKLKHIKNIPKLSRQQSMSLEGQVTIDELRFAT